MSGGNEEEIPAIMHAEDVKEAIAEAVAAEVQVMKEALEEQVKLIVHQLKATEEATRDPAKFGMQGVIARQARRAGMSLVEWRRHCERTGHDMTKMDRSIPNHSPNSGRSGNKKKTSSKKKRSKKTG